MNEENFSFDKNTGKLLYKGVDIGITYENIQGLRFMGLELTEDMCESLYNQSVVVIRDKRIDEILS